LKSDAGEVQAMSKIVKVNHLQSFWESRLLTDYPSMDSTQQDSIKQWLLGENLETMEKLTDQELVTLTHTLNSRYRILQRHYLGVAPILAYRHLFDSLGNIILKNPQIRRWSDQNCERQKVIVKSLQQMVEDMLRSDPYLKQQKAWIAQCTKELSLRNALLLTTVEEYCGRLLANHSLLLHVIFNFLKHQSQLTRLQHEFFSLLTDKVSRCKVECQNFSIKKAISQQEYRVKLALEQALQGYLEKCLVS
jgi:hypothetical protein